MKVTKQEITFLIDKYKKDGLNNKQIKKRIKDLYEFEDYIRFADKYLNKYNQKI